MFAHLWRWLRKNLICIPSTPVMTSSDIPDTGETDQAAKTDGFAKFEKVFNNKNVDTKVKLNQFQQLIEGVTAGATRPLNDADIQKLFDICDGNQDGVLSGGELSHAYEWFRPIIAPKKALINVDVQNDFINGSLALINCPARQDGAEVVPVINNVMEKMKFDMIAYSMDDHPEDHISFIDNVGTVWKLDQAQSPIKDPADVNIGDVVVFDTPRFGPVEQKIWPKHCVMGTVGREFHKDLTMVDDRVIVKKGYERDVESYTAFGVPEYKASTILKEELEKKNITELYLTGLAQDVCVANTGLDALKLGYSVCMLEDAQRGVSEETIAEMKKRVEEDGGLYALSDEVIKRNGITLDTRLNTLRRKLGRNTVAKQTI